MITRFDYMVYGGALMLSLLGHVAVVEGLGSVARNARWPPAGRPT